ncbi:hypothetical protein [Frankia sp. Cas3]|uniref:hypothetical protein n=1 Tax=Frankia sp. Cas3 TaxID=3073926 RepID=UPI002AD59A6F|nr:hypothetical protein [Frankia sp. Cas3]
MDDRRWKQCTPPGFRTPPHCPAGPTSTLCWRRPECRCGAGGGALVPQFGNQWLALSEERIARHESRLAEGGAA